MQKLDGPDRRKLERTVVRDADITLLFHRLWSSQSASKGVLGDSYDKEAWLELESLVFYQAADLRNLDRRAELIRRLHANSRELDGREFDSETWELFRNEVT